MKRILLVKNNSEQQYSLDNYLKSNGYSITNANDYSQAVFSLMNSDFNAVICDCFISEEIGSGKTDLGKNLVKQIFKLDKDDERTRKSLKSLKKHFDLENPYTEKYFRFLISTTEIEEILEDRVIKSFIQISKNLGKEILNKITKRASNSQYIKRFESKDTYSVFLKEIEKSENNQPLGLQIARISQELELPVVLMLSRNYSPLIKKSLEDYTREKNLMLISYKKNSCSNDYLWKEAFEKLKEYN